MVVFFCFEISISVSMSAKKHLTSENYEICFSLTLPLRKIYSKTITYIIFFERNFYE